MRFILAYLEILYKHCYNYLFDLFTSLLVSYCIFYLLNSFFLYLTECGRY